MFVIQPTKQVRLLQEQEKAKQEKLQNCVDEARLAEQNAIQTAYKTVFGDVMDLMPNNNVVAEAAVKFIDKEEEKARLIREKAIE